MSEEPISNTTQPARPIPESYWVIPGKFLAGEYPGAAFAPEITRRRMDALLTAGFKTLVDLTLTEEVEGYQRLLQEQANHYETQVKYLHFPIDDFGLPSRERMTEILDTLDQALADCDEKVYLHCHGGIGRTGTTVGCFLVRHGLSGQQALQQLAEWWSSVPKSADYPNSPETSQQADFILNWADD